jgi:ankyrin repeat protein
LIERGVDVNAMDARGTTALRVAAEEGNLSGLVLLLDAGAHIDAGTPSALTVAYWRRRWDSVRVLLERGARPTDDIKLDTVLQTQFKDKETKSIIVEKLRSHINV